MVIVPFIYGVYLTLTDWNGVSDVKNFVGFTNFISVVKDGQFWTSLLLTFKYVIFVVIIVNVLAFAIAYLLTRGIKAQNFFRAGFFTPNLIGGLVLGYIWQFVFSRCSLASATPPAGASSRALAVRPQPGLRRPGAGVRVAAVRLHDPHLRGRLHGIEPGRDGGRQH